MTGYPEVIGGAGRSGLVTVFSAGSSCSAFCCNVLTRSKVTSSSIADKGSFHRPNGRSIHATERYVSPYGLGAQIYAALNNKEQTFRWLQTAYDDRAVWMSYLAVDPVFDRYRSDPRLQDLLRRLGLLA
jgi:hypothetical protein